MVSDILVERRKWNRIFPEGTLEFLVITRVLALLMLMALAIVTAAQRPLAITALAAVLWVDYALLVWWIMQAGVDLQTVVSQTADSNSASQQSNRRRTAAGLTALLPSMALFVAVVPWGSVLRFVAINSRSIPYGLHIAGLVGFVVFAPLAVRVLRRAELGSPLWTVLLLIPILHWFALHRLAGGLDSRIRQQLSERSERRESGRSATTVLALADAAWVITLLPWLVVVGIALTRGWPAQGLFKVGPVCGTCVASLFAVVDLAAMESVQRKIVALIRKG